MSGSTKASVERLLGVVAPEVILDAVETSRLLTELAIPHALVGGLAVGLHGHPRATKDVDFLVGNQAFETTDPILSYREELSTIVRMGEVDLLAVPGRRPILGTSLALPSGGEIPVVGVAALILMKLDAGRAQDIADVHHLLDQHSKLIEEVGHFLSHHAPDLVDRFVGILDERESKSHSIEQ